jgi:hypothetical protein
MFVPITVNETPPLVGKLLGTTLDTEGSWYTNKWAPVVSTLFE